MDGKNPKIEDMLNSLLKSIGKPTRDMGVCVSCGNEPDGFRDEVSEREWGIGRMCQACQDRVWGGDDE